MCGEVLVREQCLSGVVDLLLEGLVVGSGCSEPGQVPEACYI